MLNSVEMAVSQKYRQGKLGFSFHGGYKTLVN